MINLGWGEILVLGFIGLIVLGPERLPKYAAEAGRLLRQLRAMAKDASSDLRAEFGDDLPDIDLRDLRNPKAAVARYLLEAGDGEAAATVPSVPSARRPRLATLEPGERPPFDVEAT